MLYSLRRSIAAFLILSLIGDPSLAASLHVELPPASAVSHPPALAWQAIPATRAGYTHPDYAKTAARVFHELIEKIRQALIPQIDALTPEGLTVPMQMESLHSDAERAAVSPYTLEVALIKKVAKALGLPEAQLRLDPTSPVRYERRLRLFDGDRLIARINYGVSRHDGSLVIFDQDTWNHKGRGVMTVLLAYLIAKNNFQRVKMYVITADGYALQEGLLRKDLLGEMTVNGETGICDAYPAVAWEILFGNQNTNRSGTVRRPAEGEARPEDEARQQAARQRRPERIIQPSSPGFEQVRQIPFGPTGHQSGNTRFSEMQNPLEGRQRAGVRAGFPFRQNIPNPVRHADETQNSAGKTPIPKLKHPVATPPRMIVSRLSAVYRLRKGVGCLIVPGWGMSNSVLWGFLDRAAHILSVFWIKDHELRTLNRFFPQIEEWATVTVRLPQLLPTEGPSVREKTIRIWPTKFRRPNSSMRRNNQGSRVNGSSFKPEPTARIFIISDRTSAEQNQWAAAQKKLLESSPSKDGKLSVSHIEYSTENLDWDETAAMYGNGEKIKSLKQIDFYAQCGSPDLIIVTKGASIPSSIQHWSLWQRIPVIHSQGDSLRLSLNSLFETQRLLDQLLWTIRPALYEQARRDRLHYVDKLRLALIGMNAFSKDPEFALGVLRQVDNEILSRMRTLENPMMTTLPVAEDWWAFALMQDTTSPNALLPDGVLSDDESNHVEEADGLFLKWVRRLEKIGTPRTTAHLFASLGSHQRYFHGDMDDIKAAPYLMANFVPYLGALLEELRDLSLDDSSYGSKKEMARSYAAALMSGLVFYCEFMDIPSPERAAIMKRWGPQLRRWGISLETVISYSVQSFPDFFTDELPLLLRFAEVNKESGKTKLKVDRITQMNMDAEGGFTSWEVFTGASVATPFISQDVMTGKGYYDADLEILQHVYTFWRNGGTLEALSRLSTSPYNTSSEHYNRSETLRRLPDLLKPIGHFLGGGWEEVWHNIGNYGWREGLRRTWQNPGAIWRGELDVSDSPHPIRGVLVGVGASLAAAAAVYPVAPWWSAVIIGRVLLDAALLPWTPDHELRLPISEARQFLRSA